MELICLKQPILAICVKWCKLFPFFCKHQGWVDSGLTETSTVGWTAPSSTTPGWSSPPPPPPTQGWTSTTSPPPTSTQGWTAPNPCSSYCINTPDGNYQDPKNCTGFIKCDDGIGYCLQCPVGLQWNQVTRVSLFIYCQYFYKHAKYFGT